MRMPITDRARRYIANMPPSIQGSGGSTALFNVALALAKGFNLPEDQALARLADWNQSNALPPWPDRDLLHKLRDASKGSVPDGYLLKEDDDHRPRTTSQPAPSVPLTPAPRRGYDPATLAGKAAIQAAWAALTPLSEKQTTDIARLRNCPGAAVDIMVQCGRLALDPARPDCFILTDGRIDGRGHRQYRTFDGTPFHHGGKSENVKSSAGKGFFTLSHTRCLDPDELVFITEGSISLLETVACQWICEGRASRWHFVAAHAACSTFASEPELLKAIAGHHVRIFPDNNDKGREAAKAWKNELRAAGCTVDRAIMPDGFQDLKTILAAGSDGVPAIRSLLTYPAANWKEGKA